MSAAIVNAAVYFHAEAVGEQNLLWDLEWGGVSSEIEHCLACEPEIFIPSTSK